MADSIISPLSSAKEVPKLLQRVNRHVLLPEHCLCRRPLLGSSVQWDFMVRLENWLRNCGFSAVRFEQYFGLLMIIWSNLPPGGWKNHLVTNIFPQREVSVKYFITSKSSLIGWQTRLGLAVCMMSIIGGCQARFKISVLLPLVIICLDSNTSLQGFYFGFDSESKKQYIGHCSYYNFNKRSQRSGN